MPAFPTRVLSAATGLRERIGLARGPSERAAHDALVTSLRARLGEAVFDGEWSEARNISLDDLVEYVSRMRGQRKRPSIGWDSLTPTKLRVAALVAEGLTNPQIGERMFIARGTVKIHIAHIFTKLGIGARAQLAVIASERAK
ncbi:MAG: helix-turn-helix transcriptional regulator [Phycisphaerae bacterium]|nr:helix-turn-helix transcriptional regulator [Gemmatimonadaceae bacterium]